MRILLTFILNAFLAVTASAQDSIPEEVNALLTKNMCSTCHKLNEKLIGPSYTELSQTGNSSKQIAELIKQPEPSNWPDYPPMAPMPFLDDKEVKKMAEWIESIANRR